MTQQSKWKWIGIALVLLLFSIGIYSATSDSEGKLTYSENSKPKKKAKPVDKEDLPFTLREVDSKDELQKFYEGRIPGLRQARKMNLTTLPDQSANVPKRDGELQINEIWYKGPNIHILYSLDLSVLMEKDSEKNKYVNNLPAVENVKVAPLTGDVPEQALSSFSPSLQYGDAVIFGNRLYAHIQTSPILNHPQTPGRQVQRDVFDEKLLTTIDLRLFGRRYTTEAVPVQFFYDPEAQVMNTYMFNNDYDPRS